MPQIKMDNFNAKTLLSLTTWLLAINSASAAITDLGCYKSANPPLTKNLGSYTYQSQGYCQQQCSGSGYSVMALTGGSTCLCGNQLPATSSKTTDGDCSSACQGYPSDTCGGDGVYSVLLTGTKDQKDIPIYGDSSSSDSTSSGTTSDSATSTSEGAQIVTQAGHTIYMTAASQTGDVKSESSSPNKAGIAAGVVIGVVALAAIVGGGFFFVRQRKRKAIEEEYRRNAAISNFVEGGKPSSHSSMADSRLDSSMMAQRRQSNGSIADGQDFSRRILQVTNPDRL